MTRADRLLALGDLLRGKESTTVAALADELGVSRRTVLRDLGTLRERGTPITGEAGPGGGIRLEGDRGVTAVHLSIAEVIAMWLAARLSRGASDLPWSEAASSGMTKLLGSLPAKKARALRALCRRVFVGEPAPAAIRASAGQPPPELLAVFERAFSSGLGLGFDYVDRNGRRSVRRVEPHGLLVEPPVWYVVARDIEKNEPRAFRMDRIARPRVLREVTFQPDVRIIESQLSDPARWRPLTDQGARR
jgi:predicted DNA-binding transcriptional regulator YafY